MPAFYSSVLGDSLRDSSKWLCHRYLWISCECKNAGIPFCSPVRGCIAPMEREKSSCKGLMAPALLIALKIPSLEAVLILLAFMAVLSVATYKNWFLSLQGGAWHSMAVSSSDSNPVLSAASWKRPGISAFKAAGHAAPGRGSQRITDIRHKAAAV